MTRSQSKLKHSSSTIPSVNIYEYKLDTSSYYLWTNISNNSILEGYQMKKLSALVSTIAIAILSGVALSKFLNWAGQQEIFDFDLNEDIDKESY